MNRNNHPKHFNQRNKISQNKFCNYFTEKDREKFGVVHISQLKKREQMQPIGKIFSISVPPILSHLDQIAPIISPCLLHASGFCKFGDACPCLNIDVNAHNSKLAVSLQSSWLDNVNDACIKINKIRTKKQVYDYLVVLDFEGLPEIVEFPAILINLRTFKVVSKFHQYVIPSQWQKDKIFENESKINEKCLNKDSNAVAFDTALYKFDKWLIGRNMVNPETVLFATCGNWDIGKQIPLQCFRNNICGRYPKYMHEWMNIKDFGYNFFQNKAHKKNFYGMKSILKWLRIPLDGTHHSGMCDTSNLTKIVLHYIKHGAVLRPTAKKIFDGAGNWTIQYKYAKANRI